MPLRRSLRRATASTSKETENPQPVMMKTFSFLPPHPLLIPNIASEIFGYLSHSTLKNCRLVCQTWNVVASKHFEKKTQIVFDSEERLAEFLDYYTVENPPLFKSYKVTSNIGVESTGFILFLDRFGVSRVRSVHFDKFSFVVNNESYMSKVFRSIHQMEEMVLDFRNCELGPSTENMEISHNLDKLKVLRCVFNNQCETETERLTDILMRLIIRSPNLERISSILKSDKKKCWNYPLQDFLPYPQNLLMPGAGGTRMENSLITDLVLTVVIACTNQSILTNFAHFELSLPLRLSLLEQMNTRRFPLKTLHLSIFDLQWENGTVEELITAMQTLLSQTSPTLETFKVSFGRGRDELDMAEIGHYNFPALRNLAIHGNSKAGHLNYINGCPNLETLHIAQALLPSNFDEFTISPPLAKLTSFVGHDIKIKGRRLCENVLVAKIVMEFPHLRRLKLDNLKDTQFSVICKELNLLEELFVLNSSVTDSGVTGISKSVLTKFASKFGLSQPVFKKRLPYIGNLKNLRNLELGSTCISDISILFGVLDCGAVRKLTIFAPKMTGIGLRCIVDQMDLLALRTVCCYALLVRDLEYARSKLADPESVILNKEKGPKSLTDVGKIIESYCVAHLEMPSQ